MALNLGTAIAYLEVDTSKFTKGFKSAFNDLKVFGDKSATATQKIRGLQSAFNTVGGGLTKGVTLPLVGVGAAALKAGSDFEAGMSEVKAISGASGKQFDKLKSKAMEMGAKTKYSASEAADAFKYMAMAGWDTEDMLDGIEGTMNLAAASGEDLASVSDIVTDALTAFGLKAKDSAHFADVLAKASSSSNTNVGLMGETFKYVAPVAGALGYSVEDTAVAIGLMANAGIKGSQSGTALRSMLTRLAKPTDTVAAAMERYNISLTDSSGNMKPFGTLVDELRDRFDGLSESEKANLAATLAGQEGMSGLIAIVNASEEDYKDLVKEINNADGAAQDMAETMMDNLQGAFTILKSNLETAAIKISEVLIPKIRDVVEKITEWVQKFNDLDPATQETIVNVGLFAAALGPVLIILSKVLGIMSKFSDKAISLASSFSSINPAVIGVIGVIALLIGVFVDLWKTNDDFRKNITQIWGEIRIAINGFVQEISDRIEELSPVFESVANAIKEVWDALCDFLAPVFVAAFDVIADTIQAILDIILGFADIVAGIFQGDFDKVKQGIKEVLSAVLEYVGNMINNIIDLFVELVTRLPEILSTIGGVLRDLFIGIGSTVLQLIGGLIESIIQVFADIGSKILDALSVVAQVVAEFFIVTIPQTLIEFATVTVPNFISSVVEFFGELPYKIGYILGQIIGHIVVWGEQLVSNGVEAAKNFIKNVVDWIKQLPGKIWTFLTETIPKIISWGANMVSKGSDAGSKFVKSVIDFIKDLPGKVWNIIKKIPEKVKEIGHALKDAGKAIFQKLWDGIKSIGESILSWVSSFVSKIGGFISGIISGFQSVVSSANSAKSAARSVGARNGSHAGGLDYVPFNGYMAELHEGERVLTKQENKEYNAGRGGTGSGDTFNFYNTKPTPYEYARQVKRAKKEILYGV